MKGKRKNLWIFVAVIAVATVGVLANRSWLRRQFFKPTGTSIEQGITADEASPIRIIARELTVPWGIGFLPNGDMLVTERPGTLRRLEDGQKYTINGVRHVGEGGLLGIALHPDFADNGWLYLYFTTTSNGELNNRVERYRLVNDQLTDQTVIIDNIPGSANHDGGRIVFGPDGKLYITTGDAGNEDAAQNKESLAGKILRINDDGGTPKDNPFRNKVYSYGHRNPQGLAWDSKGQLWETEHGPSGTQTGYDELNLIKKGANYGWPIIRGDETRSGMEKPIAQSGGNETWAPASLAYKNGSLFFGGLRGESLYEAKIMTGNTVTLKAHFRGEYGRIRTVEVGSNGYLYLSTSNTDGRGTRRPSDDKIIRINPKVFSQ